MNRKHVRTFAAAALAALLLSDPNAARAAGEADGGLPGEWLTGYAGARTLGLGGAFVATADEPLGVLWNPAGIQRMDQNHVMFENVRLFEGTSMNSLSLAIPGSRLPSFGVSMVTLRSGDFQRTDELNNDLGTFSEVETAYLLTVAKSFSSRLAIGANVKVIQQSVEDLSAGGFGMDVGAIVQATPSLRIGASAANLGGPKLTLRSTAETFPTTYRVGAAYTLFNGNALMALDVTGGGEGSSPVLHAGGEYWIQNMIAMRVGMEGDRATGGFSYRFMPKYQMDYGIADHPLGLTHRVGLSYRFGGFFASSQAEPEMFSPTGEKPTTQIRLNAHTKATASEWSLEIVDKTRQVVRKFSGPGLPPPHIQWDGKDETGLPVADGQYAYRLVVRDEAGRILDSPIRRVTISTAGPQGDVPITVNP